MDDTGSEKSQKNERRLSKTATRRLIILLAALAIGISIWVTFAIHHGREDPQLQQQLQELRESLDPQAAPRPPAN